jgi:hypothetical protein
MPRVLASFLFATLTLGTASPADAWPEATYGYILQSAVRTLPDDLQQLFVDLEPVFGQPCETTSPMVIEPAAALAVRELRSPTGDLRLAVRALREIGCGAAALNDPADDAIDALVLAERDKFAVVFYGWHPQIRAGDLSGYLATRTAEHQRLRERLVRTSELPSLSDQVELSPEFGLAAIAYSHAITDVANVWMYVWASVNAAP